MAFKNQVSLKHDEIDKADAIVSRGKHSVELVKRARVLLLAHEGDLTDKEIAEKVDYTINAIVKIRKRFVDFGFEETLFGKKKTGRKPILSGKEEARLVALSSQKAPDGVSRKTSSSLADEFVTDDGKHVSRDTVRRTLKRNNINLGRYKEWCIPPNNSPEFIRDMEEILDTYELMLNDPKKRVLVCMDETSIQLLGDVRKPISVRPVSPMKIDSEYRRNGTVNIFVFLLPFRGERRLEVTLRRTREDWAMEVYKLLYEDLPNEKKIILVCDNLNTHNVKSLEKTFTPKIVKDMMKRLEIRHTPVHGSWLNMAECEISRLKRLGLKVRVATMREMIKQVKAFEKISNLNKIKNNWRFTKNDARKKMKKIYP